MNLTVMALNLWGVNEWEHRRQAVIDWIREVEPELLALQEVVRTDDLCQASWIAERTQMTALFGAVRTIAEGTFGNAVLSRLPVLGWRNHPLTDAGSGNEPRGLLTVDVDALGHRISFTSTHLSWQFDEGWVREQQVRDLAKVIGKAPIVCGDFNGTPESAEIRFMTELPLIDAFAAANPGRRGHTWSNTNPFAAAEHEPDRRIDYVFVGAGRVLRADVVCNSPRGGAWPSDHFGVAATLSL